MEPALQQVWKKNIRDHRMQELTIKSRLLVDPLLLRKEIVPDRSVILLLSKKQKRRATNFETILDTTQPMSKLTHSQMSYNTSGCLSQTQVYIKPEADVMEQLTQDRMLKSLHADSKNSKQDKQKEPGSSHEYEKTYQPKQLEQDDTYEYNYNPENIDNNIDQGKLQFSHLNQRSESEDSIQSPSTDKIKQEQNNNQSNQSNKNSAISQIKANTNSFEAQQKINGLIKIMQQKPMQIQPNTSADCSDQIKNDILSMFDNSSQLTRQTELTNFSIRKNKSSEVFKLSDDDEPVQLHIDREVLSTINEQKTLETTLDEEAMKNHAHMLGLDQMLYPSKNPPKQKGKLQSQSLNIADMNLYNKHKTELLNINNNDFNPESSRDSQTQQTKYDEQAFNDNRRQVDNAKLFESLEESNSNQQDDLKLIQDGEPKHSPRRNNLRFRTSSIIEQSENTDQKLQSGTPQNQRSKFRTCSVLIEQPFPDFDTIKKRQVEFQEMQHVKNGDDVFDDLENDTQQQTSSNDKIAKQNVITPRQMQSSSIDFADQQTEQKQVNVLDQLQNIKQLIGNTQHNSSKDLGEVNFNPTYNSQELREKLEKVGINKISFAKSDLRKKILTDLDQMRLNVDKIQLDCSK
ncbi:Hypothetical_protein [Hexamita inflata]|uniref:Hypothetical_protein n=1 Tax=Hexamita inflata TaxID=28002 RepID=A0AA86TTJ3_9EUKA|nr:Hypothetical protein HINF_LOCUS15510 [Hexamita inflata]